MLDLLNFVKNNVRMGQRRTISSDMSDTFCNVLLLKVALFLSMIHIIYTSILCGYLLPNFIIYDLVYIN